METQAPKTLESERRILGAQHAVLGQLLETIRKVATSVLASPSTILELVEQIAKLRDFLEVHLRDEEAFLVPVLRGLGAWGELRLQCLQEEHAHQRALMIVLSGDAARRAPEELARRTLVLCADLRADMELEQKELLGPAMIAEPLAARELPNA